MDRTPPLWRRVDEVQGQDADHFELGGRRVFVAQFSLRPNPQAARALSWSMGEFVAHRGGNLHPQHSSQHRQDHQPNDRSGDVPGPGFGTVVTQSRHRARIASSPQITRARHEAVAPTWHERQHPSPETFGEGCQCAHSPVTQVHMPFVVNNNHPFQRRRDELLRQNSLGFVALQGGTPHPRHVAAQPPHRLLAQMAWAVVVETWFWHVTKLSAQAL